MDDKAEILAAISQLKLEMKDNQAAIKDEIFALKEEMLLNRDDIQYVKELRNIATVDDIVAISKDVDSLKSQRDKAKAVLAVIYIIYGFALWYIGKRFY